MNLTFHIGAPRTGSSALQNALVSLYEQNDNITIERPRHNKSQLSRYLRYFHQYPNSKLLAHFIAGYAELLVYMREFFGEDHILITEENIAGDMLGKTTQLFNNDQFFFTFIKRLSRLNDCKVVAVVRKLDDYINSCYKFQLQRKETRTIDAFVNGLNLDHIRWSKLLEEAEKTDLTENLFLIEFDSYLKHHQDFNHSELPPGFNLPLHPQHTNLSATDPFLLSFIRRVNQAIGIPIYRANEIQLQLSSHSNKPKIEVFEQVLGKEAWVKEIFSQTLNESENNTFPDVIMSQETHQKILEYAKKDTSRLKKSNRCFGDFSSW